MNTISFPSLQQTGLTLILGLGETGLAAARWCLRHGVPVRIADTREAAAGVQSLREEADAPLDLHLGGEALELATLKDVTRVVLSPGLCPFEEPLAGFLKQARAQGAEVIGEIELFALALADLATQGYAPRLIAVTGTNGKTTVTAMARRLAEAAGWTAAAAGNISPPAIAALMHALDQNSLPEVWVLELSSFQLESTFSLKPDAAVVLNLTQDHLDWHGSMQAYAAAKARLLQVASLAIVNRDDPMVLAMVDGLDSINVRSFGRGVPELEGDVGLEESQGIEWLASVPMQTVDAPASARRKSKDQPARQSGAAQRLMPVEALRLRGRHNALNALAALTLVHSIGGGLAPMLHALREYEGEPHRCQFLRSVAGVDFVNDSKGTNVGATVAALEGMGRPVVLIAGGLGKGQDFAPLAQAIEFHAKAVVLIGTDAPLIRDALKNTRLTLRDAASMDEAVQAAMDLAVAGDVVLLSPACASMDMFQNYGQRGHRFAEAVDELALDRGEVA
ncbi:MAG TPA: UDP-N-acetylmuramoyl-L-alanine--D-glutamate ligase [Burkholderiaceae bacterium]|nr:UDP-N-acetylmuramoyl-L-alanine--D-glutamate ligase [Burkholderiaceae bacterium]